MDEYINGSDILLQIADNCIGHCTTHTVTYSTDTKDRAVKPVATASKGAGLWKGKGVTGLSISIKADGLRVYEETENGYEQVAPMWGKGQSVEVKCYKRGFGSSPYLQGKFVISSLEETSPAQDDTTWTVQLENDGEPDVYPGKSSAASAKQTEATGSSGSGSTSSDSSSEDGSKSATGK